MEGAFPGGSGFRWCGGETLKTPGQRIWQLDARNRREAFADAVAALQRGQLILMPTDTVYGVAAHPTVAGAALRLFEAKGREAGKPIPLLAAGVADVLRYGAGLGRVERRLADAFWPGPLTLVLAVAGGTEGFRVPAHADAQALLEAAGGVLRVTSANASGTPPALTAEDAVGALGSFVEVALDAGRSPGGTASTVVRVNAGGGLEILREGALSRQELEKVAGHE